MKTEHVYRKFPNHIEAIQELLNKDDTFREICDDYEEMSTWLENYCYSKGRPSEECDHAREVIRDLEDEIRRKLKESRGRGFKDSSEQE